MFNVTKSTAIASTILSLVGLLGLVSIHSASAATSRQDAPAPTQPAIVRESIPAPPTVTTASETVIAAPTTPKPIRKAGSKAKAWSCGAFEPLQNDATQQVRRCEWR